jgi:glutaredoxin 3
MTGPGRITVYTTTACSFCTRVKRLLDSHGLRYEEVDLARDPETRVALAQRTGMMTFPQVLVDDELLGGFNETEAAARSGRLQQLTAESGPYSVA